MPLSCSSGKSAWRNWFFPFLLISLFLSLVLLQTPNSPHCAANSKKARRAETNPSYFDTYHALAFDFPARLERLERPARRLFRRKRIYFDPSILQLCSLTHFLWSRTPKCDRPLVSEKLNRIKKFSFPSQSKIAGTWTGDISTIWSVINKHSLIALQSFNKSTFTPSLLYFSVNLVSYLNLVTIYITAFQDNM